MVCLLFQFRKWRVFVDRNLTVEEKKEYREITWDSKEVCAYYMARFCPHDLFVNTKSDLGAF
uniref:Luc7-like protein 3 n=1 Tax=Rhizophora mucronata TaxID=61149 RepID=A0A2P2KR75_RHIMU